nr:hypothetical protein [Piscirickettsia salmonis]
MNRGDQIKKYLIALVLNTGLLFADEKTEFGHFEIDTVVGRDHQSYLLTLVDKANKMCCIKENA